VGDDPTSIAISDIGLLLGFACAATITIYTLQSKPLMAKWGSMPVVAMGMVIGGIMCAAVAIPQWSFPPLDLGGWAALAVMVIVGTCISYSLFFQAILDLPPVEVGMLSVVEPVSATFFSVVWLGTIFIATDYIGFVLMTAMVIIIAIAGDK
jgi:drug/metabolite transporter (DMT)-like permease